VWSTAAEGAAGKDEPPQGVGSGRGRTSKVRVVPEILTLLTRNPSPGPQK
jgi:hypothetical protein